MANETRVMTGKVRLSYVHVWKPYAREQGQEEKYSCTILVPKTDVKTKQAIDNAIAAAIEYGVTNKWNGKRPAKPAIPVYDGDGTRPSDGEPYGEECKGHWVFTASAKADRRPGIVDANVQPIVDQSEIYSGVYARVSVNFYAYGTGGKKGIGCGLGNIQKITDGEPLSGADIKAENEFEALEIDPLTGLPKM